MYWLYAIYVSLIHAYTHIYVYIYIYRERERDNNYVYINYFFSKIVYEISHMRLISYKMLKGRCSLWCFRQKWLSGYLNIQENSLCVIFFICRKENFLRKKVFNQRFTHWVHCFYYDINIVIVIILSFFMTRCLLSVTKKANTLILSVNTLLCGLRIGITHR